MYSISDAVETLEQIRVGKKIVLGGGTFDLLHAGHVDYLNRCKSLGDVLVICVAGDRRVQRRKGPGRPINPEASRAKLVLSLKPVDLVFTSNRRPFSDSIISRIAPDVIVTSSDEPSPEKKSMLREYFRRRYPRTRVALINISATARSTSTTALIKRILSLGIKLQGKAVREN